MKVSFVAAFAVAAVAALAACSSSSNDHDGMNMSTGSNAGGAVGSVHNQADVTFASDMIPHHGQAIEMADLALQKATEAKVKTFARQIKAAQQPEIDTMSGWLRDWGQPVPSASMDHSMGHAMPRGMMSMEDMAALAGASGAEFDRMWLEMMIEHHRGAVDMAQLEVAKGRNGGAKALAQSIIDTQTAEITELGKVYSSMGS